MESKQVHLLIFKVGLIVFLLVPLSALSTSTSAMVQAIKNINSADHNVTTTSILLTIPNGASVQGNPSYEPSPLSVEVGDTIVVENKDTTPHTVTNGKDATDPNMGKFFDTSIINAGDSGEVLTADLKPGEYPFFCAVHPYMAGILDVQDGSQASTEDPMDEQEPTTGEEQPVKADPALIKELLDDAIENLRNGNNERAIVYMDFVRQQLSLQTTNVTMP